MIIGIGLKLSAGETSDYTKAIKIKCIQLSTYPDRYCGGYNVKIEVSQGSTKCTTEKINNFDRGKKLKWILDDELGDCKNLTINLNETMSFKMKTPSYDDFCPEYLYIQLEDDLTFLNESFLSEKMEHWHDFHNNEDERNITSCESCHKTC